MCTPKDTRPGDNSALRLNDHNEPMRFPAVIISSSDRFLFLHNRRLRLEQELLRMSEENKRLEERLASAMQQVGGTPGGGVAGVVPNALRQHNADRSAPTLCSVATR